MGAADKQNADARLEDYKLRSAFASEHLGRMQTQFQVMLTLETAVATALIVSNTGGLTEGARWGALLEVFLSIGWFMVGYWARKRAELLRAGAEEAGETWAAAAGLPTESSIWSGPSIVSVAVLVPGLLTVGWVIILVVVW